uniref:Uncharacterized protein n=1 Tax=Eucampia antarctica TaxID=49252 RepID=A0A7S2WEW7_9STRA|mmetsp:Transcript_27997/g.26856  ORF Transcript_27997/g.26856 Transcript_27997/m.26856 type:complete len:137 (+) Transcript_27997:83-493(+)
MTTLKQYPFLPLRTPPLPPLPNSNKPERRFGPPLSIPSTLPSIPLIMEPSSNTSVNARVDKTVLQECMLGHCLLRLLHHIVVIRIKHPTTAIFIQRIDWKSEYRRAHMHWSTSIQYDKSKIYTYVRIVFSIYTAKT